MTTPLILEHITPRHWWQRSKWRLHTDFTSHTSTVPEGFITDGVSAPLVLAAFISPTGRAMEAAVVHDYELSLLSPTDSREVADTMFHIELIKYGIGYRRARVLFTAVRLYGIVKVAIARS